ncbi:long-chain-fatty-acid--CoA ligase 5-like [Paramacrobiotus metropolitanus]|uniref:long-chain-fatty-acid--CoA ligase 5-like n=1 Tax=Paramacrobiotus metropolitanus TaxID=2943436 RepID=UPI0024462BEB|nr:long-chain-fatty-acid--CoA ligase 5-like [Paramacrobiotus metropolitanus]
MTFIGTVLTIVVSVVAALLVPLLGIFAYDFATRPQKKRAKNFDYDQQTEEDDSGIRRRHFAGPPEEGGSQPGKTLYENFLNGVKASNNGPCLGYRPSTTAPYKWVTYQEVLDRAKRLGSGLIAKGHPADNKTFVGIQAANSVEWVVTEQAVNMYSMVIVPLYDTLGVEACNYIINFMDIAVVVVDTQERLQKIMENLGKLKPLKRLISVTPFSDDLRQQAEAAGIELLLFSDVEKLGQDKTHAPVPPKPSDLATICCTSGTTGDPKGVMLTHENMMAEALYVREALLPFQVDNEQVVISYLPLAHLYERVVEMVIMMHGARVGFFTGDVRRLTDDIKELRPTLVPAVPRVLGRIYAGVWKKARENWISRIILHVAYRMKKFELLYFGSVRTDSFWDKVVFHNVRKQMGGRVKIMMTGSAPIEGEVLTFLRVALGIPILEGYGQTECTAGATLSVIGDNTTDHVGPPMPGVEVKLVDVPDMEYYAADGQGEICIRSKINMKGYYKLQDKTDETLDQDNWLHTGDVGTWTPNGCLKVVDRKKNLFKLSQGEYIAPEKLEQSFGKSKIFHQVFVDGNSLHSFPVAIVIPEKDHLTKWAGEHGQSAGYEELLKSKEAKQYILDEFKRIAKKDGIKSFEIPQAVALLNDPFSVANGLLTPTLKAKREAVRKKYKPLIDSLYKEGEKA